MVRRLGGFFSSLRFALLNLTQDKCSKSCRHIHRKDHDDERNRFDGSYLPRYLLKASDVVGYRTSGLLDDISNAGSKEPKEPL